MTRLLPGVVTVLGLAFAALVAPPVPATAAPEGRAGAAPALTVTARYALLGDSPERAVLIGRYTCGPYPGGVAERGVVDLGLRQDVAGTVVDAFGYLEPAVCTGQPQQYAVELVSYSGPLVAGAASWSASGYVEGPGGAQSVYVPPTPIRIRSAALG
ncbi:hypothetical protein [Plantactinospora sp. CA-290183]|uniref:hypothetical protein n=1 Tax=Plantactinospora sp. CA-290183 TaxID=3240006 RepID=UPI003D92304D